MNKLAELRSAWDSSVTELETALENLENAAEDADVESLQSDFDSAVEAERSAKAAYERAASVAEARKAVPVAPVEEKRTPSLSITKEEKTYEKHNRNNSFILDTYKAQKGDYAAQQRLQRHSQEVAVERRDLNRTDGSGGELVPPLWVLDTITVNRAGRAVVDTFNKVDLPSGTDYISLPKIATGASVASQDGDGGSVSETDLTTTSVNAPVNTIAGQQDASIQLVLQSPLGMDQIIFQDLVADYGRELDKQAITGTGNNGQHTGLLTVGSTNSVTYTSASPAVNELYPKLADGVQQIHTNRYAPAEVIVMHPRRWAWLNSAVDSTYRPLVVPAANAVNPVGILENVAAESFVGTLHGLPVIVDANVPTTTGASSNQDSIIIFRPSDCILMEGTPNFRVHEQSLDSTLELRFQLFSFSAMFAGSRQPKAVSKITGTGLVAPTF